MAPADGPEATGGLSVTAQSAHLPQFDAVADALASGPDSFEACVVAGRELARDGVSMDEALLGLHGVARTVLGAEPSFEDVRALCLGWSEATLAHVNQISCEDPLTALSSVSHLRSRLSELYRVQFRDSVPVRDTHALVVVDGAHRDSASPLGLGLRLSAMGDAARAVFAGQETIARLGPRRLTLLAQRDTRLGQRVALLRRMLTEIEPGSRVWIEGLPASDPSCAALIDELTRG